MSEKFTNITLNAATGEVVEREFTSQEVQEFQKIQSTIKAYDDAKEAARQSALTKLAALGLTEAEIAAL